MKKRNNVFRWIVFVVILAAATYYLMPTYKVYANKNEYELLKSKDKLNLLLEKEKIKTDPLSKDEISFLEINRNNQKYLNFTEEEQKKLFDYDKSKGKSISLGLDLQGGMHLVLEIDYKKMLKTKAKVKDAQLDEILDETNKITKSDKEKYIENLKSVFKKNNVLLDKYYGQRGDSEDKIAESLDSLARKGIETTLEVLRNRIDQFGIAEPSIQKHGKHRIIVELPGVKDVERAKKMVYQAAFLEFKLVAKDEVIMAMAEKIDAAIGSLQASGDLSLIESSSDTTKAQNSDTLAAKTEDKTDELFSASSIKKDKALDTTKKDSAQKDSKDLAKSTKTPFKDIAPYTQKGCFIVKEEDKRLVDTYMTFKEVRNVLGEYEFVWINKATVTEDGKKYYELYLVNKKTELDGTYIKDASSMVDQSGTSGGWEVNLSFDDKGARIFSNVTGMNVKRRLAIILDGKLYMAPTLQDKISGGRAQITGNFSAVEAKDLSVILKAGALVAPLEIMEQRIVGPSLGSDSIKNGFITSVLGIIIVMLFMTFYYRISGLFASIAVSLNVIFVFAMLSAFGATLTLPGIAGIVLTVGMAVDANVIIFERIREELRSGKSVILSLNAGYEKAWNAIFDSNLTTVLAGLILYKYGSGPVKGFALTLMLGISSSMFTAIVLTRMLTDLFVNENSKKLSI